MREYDSHRVQPVAEIVRDYAEGNQQPHLRAGLKADPDCNPVEETVKGQTGRGHRAKLRLMSFREVRMLASAMHRGVAFESEECQESQRGDRHIRRAVVECENFRQYVEQRDRQDAPELKPSSK